MSASNYQKMLPRASASNVYDQCTAERAATALPSVRKSIISDAPIIGMAGLCCELKMVVRFRLIRRHLGISMDYKGLLLRSGSDGNWREQEKAALDKAIKWIAENFGAREFVRNRSGDYVEAGREYHNSLSARRQKENSDVSRKQRLCPSRRRRRSASITNWPSGCARARSGPSSAD